MADSDPNMGGGKARCEAISWQELLAVTLAEQAWSAAA